MDAVRERLGISEEHPVVSAAAAAQLELRVLSSHHTLGDDIEDVQKARFREALSPHALGDRARGPECKLFRRKRTVGLETALEIGLCYQRAHRILERLTKTSEVGFAQRETRRSGVTAEFQHESSIVY